MVDAEDISAVEDVCLDAVIELSLIGHWNRCWPWWFGRFRPDAAGAMEVLDGGDHVLGNGGSFSPGWPKLR